MKGKLITNGILSLIIFIGHILMLIWITKLKDINWKEIDTTSTWTQASNFMLYVFILTFVVYFASFIMGIITLCTLKKATNKGFAVASGILAILGGAYGANAIVSFLGAYKEKNKGKI